MAEKQDRRVQRTHQLLREALFSLIQERGFEVLSVQDIIDRANVGRATFYAHFENKEDLLLSGFESLRVALRRRQHEALSREANVEERVFAFSNDMLVHVNEHRNLFRAMAGKRSGAAVQNALHKLVLDLVREDLKAMATRSSTNSADNDAAVHFIAGGLFGVLMWWLGSRGRLSAEELNRLFLRFAIPAAKAALLR